MVKDTFGLLSGTVEFSNTTDAKQKTNLSILHMHSASILNKESAKCEKLKSNKYLQNNKDKFDYLSVKDGKYIVICENNGIKKLFNINLKKVLLKILNFLLDLNL